MTLAASRVVRSHLSATHFESLLQSHWSEHRGTCARRRFAWNARCRFLEQHGLPEGENRENPDNKDP